MPRRTMALICALALALVVMAAACAPATAPTPTPIPKVPASTAVPATPTTAAPASQTPAGTPKPAATTTTTAATPTVAAPTAAPKAAVAPLDPPVSVKVGGAGSLTEAFLYIADARGYFAQEGLKVEFVRFASATQMVAPLGTGELDAGGGSPGPGLFNAIVRDIPLKIVADRTTSLPGRANIALMVRKDLIDSGQVKDFKDFKGKNIAINAKASSTEIFLVKALEKGGLTEADVNVVTMGFPDTVAAFASKGIDIAFATDPSNARAIAAGTAVRWKGEDEVFPGHEPSVLLYGPNFYQNKAEAAKRLMVAYVRGIRDYIDAFTKNKDKEQIISILMNATDAKERPLYDIMTVLGVDPDGRVNVQSLTADQDWYFAQGLMQQKVDMSKVIDYQYVDYAVQRLGKYQP